MLDSAFKLNMQNMEKIENYKRIRFEKLESLLYAFLETCPYCVNVM